MSKHFEKISYLLKEYTRWYNVTKTFNIRRPNFPEYVSENIVKFFINKFERVKCVNSDVGDLCKIIDFKKIRVEVKCFTTNGPISFGPNEYWDEIYFLDASNFLNDEYKIYKADLSNTNSNFLNLKVSKLQTFGMQCSEKRRPRINFSFLKQQLDNHKEFSLVYSGSYENLLNLNEPDEVLKMNPIRVADFFCGIGNIGRGFEEANKNYKVVYANDMDKYCKKTYDANSKEVKMTLKNITEIDEKELPDFDIFCGGFPCQPFSVAGKQKGFEDERANVFYDILRILRYKKPRCIFLENVKNLVNHMNGETFKIITSRLEKLGYKLHYKVLNSSEYGNIPHNRERIYIVGFLNDPRDFKFIDKIDLTVKLSEMFEKDVGEEYYYGESSNIYEKLVDSVEKVDTVYQYRRYYVRENKSNCCPTLTANMGTGGHNVPIILDSNGGIRKLTPKECFKLQGLEDFVIPGDVSNCQLYKQAGNSVTLPVIRRLAENIYDHLNMEEEGKENDLVSMKVSELKRMCRERKLKGYSKKKKEDLIAMLS